MQFLEVILIEIIEEPTRADGMTGDFEVVNVPVPVLPDFVYGRHADNNIAGFVSP